MAFLPVVIVVALAVIAWLVLRDLKRGTERSEVVGDELVADPEPKLDYRIPHGQDPSVLIDALHNDGYDATVDVRDAVQHLLIACPAGLDQERAHVRAIIAHTGTAIDHPAPLEVEVRFEDERTDGPPTDRPTTDRPTGRGD